MKAILYIATIISIVTYLFWEQLPKGTFYIGNSLFIYLLCMYLFATDSKSFIKFVLFGLAINNVFDEIFFDPTKLQLNEVLTGIAILGFGIKKYYNDRKRA